MNSINRDYKLAVPRETRPNSGDFIESAAQHSKLARLESGRMSGYSLTLA